MGSVFKVNYVMTPVNRTAAKGLASSGRQRSGGCRRTSTPKDRLVSKQRAVNACLRKFKLTSRSSLYELICRVRGAHVPFPKFYYYNVSTKGTGDCYAIGVVVHRKQIPFHEWVRRFSFECRGVLGTKEEKILMYKRLKQLFGTLPSYAVKHRREDKWRDDWRILVLK